MTKILARVCVTTILVITALAASATVRAQTREQIRREEDLNRREVQMRAVEEENRKRDPKTLLAEVNDDIARLNALNETISAALTAITRSTTGHSPNVQRKSRRVRPGSEQT